ncbi:MAG: glutamine amidotransferase, partial [Candidatus Omnitrophica bacterium]|nr:glutamine amidotransferase [Candidatus Omnitrophota bacterium]
MASAAIIRNIALEGPGSIAQILRDASLSMRIYDASSDIASLDLEETAALVVLGGPMNVYEEEKYPFLTGEVRLLRRALGRDMPILGICLGA